MKRTITVHLGADPQIVGRIYYNSQGNRENAAFEYDAAWLNSADRFAIDPTLPLVAGSQFHRKTPNGSLFHGAIADTEADGWGRRVTLRDYAKRREKLRLNADEQDSARLNELDFLLAVDDESRVGALRFQDQSGIFQRASDREHRTAPPLIELRHLLAASRAVEENTETAADLKYLQGCGTSLGGLRPKCTVVDDQGRLSIGKFPSMADERAVTKGEVLAMRLAAEAGINVAQAQLIQSDNIPVALIRRFDRSAKGERILYVSAATMLGVEAADAEEHSYTEIVDALRIHGTTPQADIEELWRRIAFSILINNVDDHLRNHGFLHTSGGNWRLAPAFDLNPFPDRLRELKTWISEGVGPGASIKALLSTAPYFKLSAERARGILREVEHAVSGWRRLGEKIGLIPVELDQFQDAFEHKERLVAQQHS